MKLAGGRPRSDDLGPGPDPGEVLIALRAEPGLACLWGSWLANAPAASAGVGAGSATTVLIMSQPRASSRDAAALDSQPMTVQTDPGGTAAGIVGGGWVGWLGYDAPNHLAFYDHLLRWAPDTGRWSFEALWTRRRASALRARRDQLRELLASIEPPVNRPWRGDPGIGAFGGASRDRYLAAVEAAIELIRAGEIYQANICTRIAAEFGLDRTEMVRLFVQAVRAVHPRFGALIDGGDRMVVSLSPELFIRRVGDQVVSSPIKGTWVRDPGNPRDDGAERLRHSAKDVAENVMILDLVRNDLGRVARPGTVEVEQLLSVQPHPGVWHLVSTVAAQLRPSVGDGELVAATFPPGSVTGAPKVRAMQAITAIEDGPRGVYTGAIGIAGPVTGLMLSVAIRTFEITDGRIELGVGGGITADSVPELEWRECVHKATPLIQALGARPPAAFTEFAAVPSPELVAGGLIETMLAVDGQVLRLADHLSRLDRSARELYGSGVPATVAARVRVAASGSSGRVVVRVVLAATGPVEVSTATAGPRPSTTAVYARERPGVWRHKWADRSWIDPAESAEHGPLFVGADGTVLETARGNVFVVEPGGTLVTPPLRDDLLPGVSRRAVLDLARDRSWPTRVEPFGLGALFEASAVFWTSSLSGVVAITEVDGRALEITDAARELSAAIASGLGHAEAEALPLHRIVS